MSGHVFSSPAERSGAGEGDRRNGGGGGSGPPSRQAGIPLPPFGGTPPASGRREAIIEAARAWLGTPYQHQASRRGAGCDCLGLVRGVWREVVGREPEPVPAYRSDWAEVGGAETLLLAARRRLIEIDPADAAPGDVLLFRMEPRACVKHCAILTAPATAADPHARMIHAYWGRAVVESWLGPWWARRVAAAFGFPTFNPPP